MDDDLRPGLAHDVDETRSIEDVDVDGPCAGVLDHRRSLGRARRAAHDVAVADEHRQEVSPDDATGPGDEDPHALRQGSTASPTRAWSGPTAAAPRSGS
jgi:hypothetical protein